MTGKSFFAGHIMSRILFDKRDHQLLSIVNEVLTRDKSSRYSGRRIHPYLHPHGITEMAESKGLRIASAVVRLVESLEEGGVDDRLSSLRSLRNEVLSTATGPMPKNTARVLLQIMKELVRAHGNYQRQLELAHDFRAVAAGNPRVIRSQLRHHHLLEMPEEWNHIAFDDHVHDVNTKGRKTSCHLIMDAWIKGIRRLRVIYYNYLEPKFAVELVEAAEIMGITIRIGIELNARFRDRYVQIIWAPRGFADTQSFLCFLAEDPVMAFMAEGKMVSEYQQKYVMAALREFNDRHRHDISEAYGFDPPLLRKSEFLSFVGSGQASILHLAEFIHTKILPIMQAQVKYLRKRYARVGPDERSRIAIRVKRMNGLDSDTIVERYLLPGKNPIIPDPNRPVQGPDIPGLLKLSPHDLITQLSRLHSSYRITLNLSNLKVEDVLELLYDCEGMITRLEIFNLKDYAAGKTSHIREINELQRAINAGNVINLKWLTRKMIARVKASGYKDKEDRIEKLSNILHDIGSLEDLYKGTALKSRVGSDSTGRSPRVHGMGLAIKQTLPRRAQKEIERRSVPSREIIPINITTYRQVAYIPRVSTINFINVFYRLVRRVPLLRLMGEERDEGWRTEQFSSRVGTSGNIVTLGGFQEESTNGLTLDPPESGEGRTGISWKYLNSGLKNGLKVLIGFIPAFATFALTKDWWLLAYFGAFIWFGITGLRNVLQSVLGGGGIRRSHLMRWNDYVSWTRISDSLLFTGFSVPLLDYLAKTLLLDRLLGINTSTNPAALYGVMALTNGLYISCHNAFRGLPRGAVLGNFFRSILSIPIAVALNASTGGILAWAGFAGVNDILQKWAAIISKAASDLVAGIIEGTADRYNNIRMRWRDYGTKLDQLFDIYAQLELLFPEADVLELLESPHKFQYKKGEEVRDLEKIIIINALDLLYFWNYQPRARSALRALIRNLSDEERQVVLSSHFILLEQRKISMLFVEGLVGRNFSRPLSFYLNYSREYLYAIKKIANARGVS